MSRPSPAALLACALAGLVVGVAEAQEAEPGAPSPTGAAPTVTPTSAPGLAHPGEPAVDPAAEQQYGVCVHCHGAHGEGRPELGAPRIGDLTADYVVARMGALRAQPDLGHVPGPGDAERLQLLAGFVEALTPEHRSPGEPNPAGQALYAACLACHGVDARGSAPLKAPDLLHQTSAYLVQQLRHYRDKKRGGEGADPLAVAMATSVAAYSDADIDAVVAHIASLRPERGALNQYEVSVPRDEGLKAFADIYAVATHPRCLNCHPDGDRPLHTDRSIPHDFDVTRFTPLSGVHCISCHPASPVGDGRAPLPPADPIWSMAPKQMVFQNRSPRQLCETLKDPEKNGGRGHVDTTAHIANDHLLMTSWHSGRQPPPVSHEELVKRFETWGKAGGPCPDK